MKDKNTESVLFASSSGPNPGSSSGVLTLERNAGDPIRDPLIEALRSDSRSRVFSESLATQPLQKSQHTFSPESYTSGVRKQFTLRRELDGAVWLLNSPCISLGRSKTAQLRVSESITVSRQHAVIYVEENFVEVKDLGSSNGTYINGLRLSPYQKVRIVPSDVITLGDQEFKLL